VDKPVIVWDGKHLPKELKSVPPGQYALEAIQDIQHLSPEEERGVLEALRELDAGQGKTLAEVLSEIRGGSSHA